MTEPYSTADNSTRRPPRALVAGGSLAGLFAGTLLHQQGWDVDIFERSAHSLESQGAGLVQQADLVRALRALGIASVGSLGVTAFERVTLNRDGSFADQDRSHQTQHAWDSLYRILRQRFPEAHYHLNSAVTGFTQDAVSVTLTLADGGKATGDLLIAADGTLSALRGLLAPETAPRYAGYVAWRGLIPESLLTGRAKAALAGRFAFYRYDGSHILGYLIPGPNGETAEGARRYNWVWYRQAATQAEIDRLLTDRQGVRHAVSMPPNGLDPAVVTALQTDAGTLLPPPLADAVAATRAPFIQAIQDLESPRLAFGRIALIGDAASVVRPHTAMGIDKAAGDAFYLAEALVTPDDVAAEDKVPAALKAWEPDRLAHARAIAAHGRRLGAPLEPRVASES
ncbi:hypothetical protein HBA54_25320 [Pelagibius litoralis]|uniref:2-polyprenyl-6-methoxyphenol hydroxylase n=1 Tax=Pelagibius litoralis TaxID=374515 RepID=A0A967KEG9_9PROT|nr:FAD binding domain-containing protein [Pelagibius litoralis]NIA71924.1 hypothetical protein [Pelagibius litoralis]